MLTVRDRLSRKQSKKFSPRRALDLESSIQFEQERVSRSRVECYSIRFNLDQDILQTIQYARETGRPLYIPRQRLAELRYWALIDSENRLQSDLTFYTYYLQGGSQEVLMRSVISLDGEVLHQIKNDCLEYPDFCHQLTSAHHWLITQHLNHLRLGTFPNVVGLAWMVSWIIAAAIAVPLIPLVIQVSPWLLLALVLMLWLLHKVLQRLFLPLLRSFGRWVLRQLLSGLLSHKLWEKKIAKGILARFVT